MKDHVLLSILISNSRYFHWVIGINQVCHCCNVVFFLLCWRWYPMGQNTTLRVHWYLFEQFAEHTHKYTSRLGWIFHKNRVLLFCTFHKYESILCCIARLFIPSSFSCTLYFFLKLYPFYLWYPKDNYFYISNNNPIDYLLSKTLIETIFNYQHNEIILFSHSVCFSFLFFLFSFDEDNTVFMLMMNLTLFSRWLWVFSHRQTCDNAKVLLNTITMWKMSIFPGYESSLLCQQVISKFHKVLTGFIDHVLIFSSFVRCHKVSMQ